MWYESLGPIVGDWIGLQECFRFHVWRSFHYDENRETIDAYIKRLLTKEKIDRQLSGQTGTTTPFMKEGDVYHSNNKTVSFNTDDLIREQLDSLNSMVYNISIQKEGNNRPFKPQIHQKRNRPKLTKLWRQRQKIDHLVGIE